MQGIIPEKKKRLLDTAKRMMLQNGFVATTVDEICKAAEVTKGSFFYYFKSKEQLAKTLVEMASACCDPEAEALVCCEGDDPLERIFGELDAMIEMAKDPCSQGCLVGTFAQEISESHPELRALCADFFELRLAQLKVNLVAAKEQYAPEREIDLEGLAEMLVVTMQGALILIKAKQDAYVMERTLTHYRNYLKMVFGR